MRIYSGRNLVLGAVAALSLLCANALPAAADSFQGVDPTADGFVYGSAYAISGDGSTIVGILSPDYTNYEAMRWTSAGGMESIGALVSPYPGVFASATAVNSDGSVVVGISQGLHGPRAFRWTQTDGMVDLGDLACGCNSAATGVSGDGSVVVGTGTLALSGVGSEAFRWTQSTGMVGIGFLATGFFQSSNANAISSDGTVIVGQSNDLFVNPEAFRWTETDGMVGLGFLPGASYSNATAVSSDGTVIVGAAGVSSGDLHAFRWTLADGMVDLGATGIYTSSEAFAVSADGNVVVGDVSDIFSMGSTDARAFRWTQADGMQLISDVLTAAGLDMTGWSLYHAAGISADGTIIVGDALDPSSNDVPWIARIVDTAGGPPPGLITMDEVERSFASLGGVAEAAAQRVDQGLGAQADFISHDECGAQLCVFALGAGETGSDDADGAAGLGTVGIFTRTASSFLFGGSVGGGGDTTDLAEGGSANSGFRSATAFAGYLPASGPRVLVVGTFDSLSARIDRGYLNASSPDSSSGRTNGMAYGALTRAGWSFGVGKTATLTPFAEYGITRLRYDGWSETGGAFPASFDSIDSTVQKLRLGVEGGMSLGAAASLWSSLAWGKRIDASKPEISGDLTGLFGLTVPSQRLSQNWMEAKLGVNQMLAPGLGVGASATASMGAGLEPIAGLRISLTQAF